MREFVTTVLETPMGYNNNNNNNNNNNSEYFPAKAEK
jgi:hypothetical protein